MQHEPDNDAAWLWLSRAVSTEEQRRACLDRALAINPHNQEARQALLAWLTAGEYTSVSAADSEERQLPTAIRAKPPASAVTKPAQSTTEIRPVPGTRLDDFLLQLNKNYNILKEREAKYGSTAAPLDLLNQIDDYEHAIALTQEAIVRAAPLEDLQEEFNSLNLQISTVVFVAREPPRKPFKGLNPYRGLRKFTEEDASFFFGRNAAIQSLLDTVEYLVGTETSQEVPDLLAVLGPSGSGKSSLVRAGLIPALWKSRIADSQQWPIKVMLPGAHPLDALAETFVGETRRSLADLRLDLDGDKKALHHLMVEALAGKPKEAVFVLVIDQFEELFTLCEVEAERRAFIDQLLYATQVKGSRGLVVLTMRSDFYSKVAAYKPLAEAVTQHQMLVSPMTEKELREAILLPAEAVGLELEKALVETLLKDTFEAPGVLPLLQHALLELFHRRDGNLLTLDAYNEIGGVKGALAHRANGVIKALTTREQRIARRIFMRLIRLGEGTADTRRRAAFDEVLTHDSETQQVESVVKTLADANLLITNRNPETGEIVLDVSHEALIQEWPLLRHWMDEDRQGLRIRQQLSQAARDWQERQRDADSLYRGARLLEAEEWVAANPGEINPLEQAFLSASLEARERAAAEQEAQRQRELEAARRVAEAEEQRAQEAEARAQVQAQAAKRLRRRAIWVAGVGLVAILLAIAAGVFGVLAVKGQEAAVKKEEEALNAQATAVAEKDRADLERDRALAGQLAAQARTILDSQPDLALLFSLQAYNMLEARQFTDTFEARSSLLAGLVSHPQLKTFLHGHNGWVNSVAVSPDGQTLASGSSDGTIILWDVASGAKLGRLEGQGDVVNSVAFSPDGQTLASNSADGTITLWDVDDQTVRDTLISQDYSANTVAFSPDGQTLASGTWKGPIILWDVDNQTPRDTLTGHEEGVPVKSVAFSPDGQTLASGYDDGTIILWDMATGDKFHELRGHVESTVSSVAFSPDGQTLASGGWDFNVVLWDVASGEPLGDPLTGHTDWVFTVAFSPDGQILASGGEDNKIILWDVATSQRRGDPLTGHSNSVNSLVFVPESQTLISGSKDTSIIVWDTEANPRLGEPLIDDTEAANLAAISPDGQTVALVDYEDGTMRLWDVASGQPRGEPFPSDGGHIVFSPDGQTVALMNEDGTIVLWDVASGQPRGEPFPSDGGHIVFSPDGQTMALARGDDCTIMLRDVTTGQPRSDRLTDDEYCPEGEMAFSPDGRTLASGNNDPTIILLWDLTGDQLRAQPLKRHSNDVHSFVFSPDSKILVSGSEDKTIILWDVTTGKPIGEPLVGHTGLVYDVAFSPDGQTIGSVSYDKTIRLWDVTSHQLLGVPFNTEGGTSLLFSSDGHSLISDNGIRWDIKFESWQNRACRIANRNLTQAEWEQFIGPDIPYEPTCTDLLQASQAEAALVKPTATPNPTPTTTATGTPAKSSAADTFALPPTSTPEPTTTPSPTSTPTPTNTLVVIQPTATRPLAAAPPGIFQNFESQSTWKRGDQPYGSFERSAAAYSGSFAGQLNYNFPAVSDNFVVFLWPQPLSGEPRQITAWVKGDGSGHFLNIWVKDSAGETWQFTFGRIEHTGWRQMTAPLNATAKWPAGRIAGPSNGVIDYPISFQALVLDGVPDGAASRGTIYIDDLTSELTKAPTPKPAASPAPLTPDDTVLYSHNFDFDDDNWFIGQDTEDLGVSETGLINGKYRFTLTPKTDHVSWIKCAPGVYDNFILTVDALPIAGPYPLNYGLVFRWDDWENYYAFELDNDGAYSLDLFKNDKFTALIGWTDSAAINNSGNNHIVIKAVDATLSFFVNNQHLTTITNDSLRRGEICFLIKNYEDRIPTTIDFDNIRIETAP